MDKANFRPIENVTQRKVALFWSRVAVGKSAECWEWRGGTFDSGYGLFSCGGCSHGAHRFAYYLWHNVDPTDAQVCHRCDNPLCCNPLHLFLGTIADNMLDKTGKGRCATGERNGNAKLTSEQVVEIKRLYATGHYSHSAIATQFNVSRHTVGRITQNQAWRFISTAPTPASPPATAAGR